MQKLKKAALYQNWIFHCTKEMQHIDLQMKQSGLKSWHEFVFLYFYVGKESLSSFQSSQKFIFFLLDNIQLPLLPKIFTSHHKIFILESSFTLFLIENTKKNWGISRKPWFILCCHWKFNVGNKVQRCIETVMSVE